VSQLHEQLLYKWPLVVDTYDMTPFIFVLEIQYENNNITTFPTTNYHVMSSSRQPPRPLPTTCFVSFVHWMRKQENVVKNYRIIE